MTFLPTEPIDTEQLEIVYPESDGKPMADNTLQFRWIVMLQGGLDAVFRDRDDVFVAGDLFWYPVEGQPRIVVAPDTMVVFGRPKGDRRSYLQWREAGIGPQVVFEVLSDSNSVIEMELKRLFYERYGVEEYYLYDPDTQTLEGWLRKDTYLVAINPIEGWVSPRLGIRFEPGEQPEDEWRVYGPDGRLFVSFVDMFEQRNQAEQQARQAEQQARQAEQQARQAEQQARQAEQQVRQAEQQTEQERLQREQAEQRAQQAEQQIEQERLRVAQLEARLKELLGKTSDEKS
jgi:Uma2 family endonuclease